MWLLEIYFSKSVIDNRLPSRCNWLHINRCDSLCLNLKIKMFRNTGNRLQMLCNLLHKFENVLSQVVTFEIWNPTFKNIGNRLHTHGNRLLLCKTVIKLFGLLVIDYCLLVIDYQRVKTLVKYFSLKNSFWQIVLFNLFFWKKSFSTYLDAHLGSCFLSLTSYNIDVALNPSKNLISIQKFPLLWHNM